MHVLVMLLVFGLREANSEKYKEGKKEMVKLKNNAVATGNYKILPQTFERPVDFRHLTKQGFGDIDFKEPFDALHSTYENIRGIKLGDEEKIRKSDIPKFNSPKAEMLYYKVKYDTNSKNDDKDFLASKARLESDSSIAKSLDLTVNLEKNLAYPISRQNHQNSRFKGKAKPVLTESLMDKNTGEHVGERTLGVWEEPERLIFKTPKLNWTTCDEFARGALFHPNDVVGTEWLPFFVWSTKQFMDALLHTFSFPTQRLVKRFKETFGPYLRKFNWNQPKLLLKEFNEMLLIAGDRKGLFYGIIDQELSDFVKRSPNYTLPLIKLRLKIVDPYLAMMYCDEPYAKIMAELGTEPEKSKDKRIEAQSLGFIGVGNPVYRNIVREVSMKNFQERMKAEAEAKKYIPV